MTRKGVLEEKALIAILLLAGLLGVGVMLWGTGILHAPSGDATGAAVAGANMPPVWTPETTKYVIAKNQQFTLALPAVFSDPEGEPLTFIATQTENLDVQVSNDILTITPEPGFAGERVVTVIASDGTQVTSKRLNIEVGDGQTTPEQVAPQPEAPVSSGEAAPAERTLEKVEASVEQAVLQQPEVQVIVILKQPAAAFAAAADNTKQETLDDQKARVDEAQSAIEQSISAETPAATGAITGAAVEDGNNDIEITRSYDTINAIAVNLTQAGLEQLRNDPNVEQILLDRTFSIQLAQSVPLIDADDVWNRTAGSVNVTGQGESICVLDTGIDFNHSAFTNKIVGGYDYVNNDNSPQDDASNSHGTHVSGIAAGNSSSVKGVAPDARIVPIKVCNGANSCTGSAILAGIDYCNNNSVVYNIDAISMSLGDNGQYNSTTCPTAFESAFATSASLGIIPVAASGNNGNTGGVSYPSCSSYAISVGSSSKADALDSFSNRGGDRFDVLAPGHSIVSSIVGGSTGSLTGTSMATPHVSGAIALIQQSQKSQGKSPLSVEEMRQLFKDTGVAVSGLPRIDVLAALVQLDQNITLNISDNSVTNRTPPSAKVKFASATDLSQFVDCAQVQYNFVSIDSDRCPQYNKSAHITFSGLPGVAATPLLDGEPCDSSICTNTVFSGGVLDFDVTGFSNYSSNSTFTTSTPCATCDLCTVCAAVAGTTCTPLTDIVATTGSNCINVTANNVVIDCAGATITTTSSNSAGVLINGTRNNVSVRNCIFNMSALGISTSTSQPLGAVQNGTIANNVFNIANTGTAYAISVYFNGTNITGNVITNNGTGGGSVIGIFIEPPIYNDTANNVTTISDVHIEYNNISIGSDLFPSEGITLAGQGSANITGYVRNTRDMVINNNKIVLRGPNSGNTIQLGMQIQGINGTMNLTNNTIDMNGTGNFTFAFESADSQSMRVDGLVLNLTQDQTANWFYSSFSSSLGQSLVVSNIVFNDINGSIAYPGPITPNTAVITRQINRTDVNITFNHAFANTTMFPFLSTTANVTLRGLPFTLPKILRSTNEVNYVDCGATCSQKQYFNGTLMFRVSAFTSYIANESGVELSKNDSVDPVNVSNTMTYTILINASANASNVTLTDTLPRKVTFISAQPSPLSGTTDTFIVGNLTNGTEFRVNITVRIGLFRNGTVINNTANITFQNQTGAFLTLNVSENTTVLGLVVASCPVKINGSVVLDRNLQSNDTCITFGNSSIDLDCDGFSLTYGINGLLNDTMAVNVTNSTNSSIVNCVMIKGNVSGFRTYGVGVITSPRLRIENNTIATNGSGSDDGIHISDAGGTNPGGTIRLVTNPNNIYAPSCVANAPGVSYCSVLYVNDFNDRGTKFPLGFGRGGCQVRHKGYHFNTVLQFNLSVLPTSGAMAGIGGEFGGCALNGVEIWHVYVNNNCRQYKSVKFGSTPFVIGENNLTCYMTGIGAGNWRGFGLDAFSYDLPPSNASGTTNVTVKGNSIIASSGNDTNGVFLDADNSTITNNTIVATGNSLDDGIETIGGNAVITGNVILTRAVNQSHALFLSGGNNTLIANNTLSANTTGSAALFMGGSVTNSTVQNNTLASNGTGTSGIYLSSSTGHRFINNTFLNTTGAAVYAELSLSNVFSASTIPAAPITSLLILENDGSINYTQQLSLFTPVNLSQVVNISYNSTFVNTSDAAGSQLNASALLSFFGILDLDADPVIDAGDNGSFALCQGPRCANRNFDPGNSVMTYNVQSFTTYSTKPVQACGVLDYAAENDTSLNIVLTRNVTSNDTCFQVFASNFTLDCQGNTILYGAQGTGAGIAVGNASNITIENCIIRDINASGSAGYGIYFSNSSYGFVINNTITTNGTSSNHGVQVETLAGSSVNNFTIVNNTIMTFGTSAANNGVNIEIQSTNLSSSSNHTVIGNNISTNGTSDNVGINIFASNGNMSNNTVFNNTIRTHGSTGNNNHGVYLREATGALIDSTVAYNNIITNGSSQNNGVFADPGTIGSGVLKNTLVANNTIVAGGSGFFNVGVEFIANTSTIDNNLINTTGVAGFDYGIYVNGLQLGNIPAFNLVITRNNISTTDRSGGGANSQNFGILVNNNIRNSYVIGNTITTNGSGGVNIGISLDDDVYNTTVENNTVVTGGKYGSNYGIALLSDSAFDGAVIDNNVTNNTVNTTGDSLNIGLFLFAPLPNANVVQNNRLRINTVHARGNSTKEFGAMLSGRVFYNNLTNNQLISNGTDNNDGVFINTSGGFAATDDIIENNNISTWGNGSSNVGVHLTDGVSQHNITNNTIVTHGIDTNHGVFVQLSSPRNLIARNNITMATFGANNSGVDISGSTTNIVRDNLIRTNNTPFDNGILLTTSANNNNVSNNTIVTNGTVIKVVSSQSNLIKDQNATTVAGGGVVLTTATLNNFTDDIIASDTGIGLEFSNGTSSGTFFSGFEGGTLSPLTTSGNNVWAINNTDVFQGSFSAQSGDINDSQSAVLTLALSAGAGTVSFARKVESESGFDFLTFRIDGVTQQTWSGLLPYAVFNFSFTSASTFTWTYSKDSSVTVQNDTAFVDNINISFAGGGAQNNTFTRTLFYANQTWFVVGAGDTNNTVQNVTFVGQNGSINFPPLIHLGESSNATIQRMNNTLNLSYVNSSALALPFFNNTAILRFSQTRFIDPVPFRDPEDDLSFAYCRNSTPGHCTKLAYVNNEFVINVSGFTFYALSEGQVNLTLNKTDSPDPVPASSQLNYTIIVNNSGTSTALNLTLLEIYPNEVIFLSAQPSPEPGTNNTFFLGNFSPDSQIQLNITVFVRNITADSVINNTVNATFLNQSNATIHANVTESTTVLNPAVLNMSTVSIVKTDSPDPVNASRNLTYVINVTSTGPGIARNVSVNDTYPSDVIFLTAQPTPIAGTNNTFFLGNITNGTSVLINITVLVRNTSDGLVLNNSANVTFHNNSNFTFTAVATANTTVNNPPVINGSTITVTKSNSPDPVSEGGTLSYTITVTSSGTATAFNVTVNDTYPSGVVFDSSQPTPIPGTNNSFLLGNLTAGTVVVVNITVNVTAPGGSTLTNNVNATGQNTSSGLISATASSSATVSTPAVPSVGGGGGWTTPTTGGVNRSALPPPAATSANGGACIESWNCNDWGPCVGGTAFRTCTDSSVCNTFTLKPADQKTCEMPPVPVPEAPKIEKPEVHVPEVTVPALTPAKALPWKWVSAIVLLMIAIIILIVSLRRGGKEGATPVEKPVAAPRPAPKLTPYRPPALPKREALKLDTKGIANTLKDTDKMLKELEKALKKQR